jgi:hypothetical protein
VELPLLSAPTAREGASRWAWLAAPVDVAALVWLRVTFGLILFYEMAVYAWNGWITYVYAGPPFHFTYYGFSWVQPWPGWGMHAHFALLGVLALMIAAGCFYRVASALFAVGWTYLFLLDQSNYNNHLYFICILAFFMPFLPAHRSFSVDARRHPELRSDWVPAWSLWLLRAQVGIVYFFGGVAKLNADWLLHAQPLLTWMEEERGLPLLGPVLAWDPTAWFMSWSGMLIDLLAFPLLVWRRTRPFMVLVLMSFHTLNSIIFEIGIFPYLMVALTLLFLEPDWPRRVLARFAPARAGREPRPPAPARLTRLQAVGMAVIAVHLVIQLAMPLRKHLYPGNTMWTGEGWRFSWHMMLRDVDAELAVLVTDPVTGRSWTVDPSDLLTPNQVHKMERNPDMLVQFAHYVKRRMAEEGHRNVQVRFADKASLNGRTRQRRLDARTDFTTVERRLWPPLDWVVPLEAGREPSPAPGR